MTPAAGCREWPATHQPPRPVRRRDSEQEYPSDSSGVHCSVAPATPNSAACRRPPDPAIARASARSEPQNLGKTDRRGLAFSPHLTRYRLSAGSSPRPSGCGIEPSSSSFKNTVDKSTLKVKNKSDSTQNPRWGAAPDPLFSAGPLRGRPTWSGELRPTPYRRFFGGSDRDCDRLAGRC